MGRFQPGAVLGGDFEIVRLLAEGGMGAVYEATQKSTGARRAIKTMRPELAKGEGFRKRFEQEARIAARIESDHVVKVHSAGIDEASATAWIAMEFVRGVDLRKYVHEKGALPASLARAVLAQTCHALAAAHAARIVHRDLKPENILVSEGTSASHSLSVKILDFGIAKMITAAEATTTGAMSPARTIAVCSAAGAGTRRTPSS
jgi:serine/threonine protein kinase